MGATYLAEGFQNEEVWKAKMLEALGRPVELHLNRIWRVTQKSYVESFQPRWRTPELEAALKVQTGAPGRLSNPELPGVPSGVKPLGEGPHRLGKRINGGGEKTIHLLEGRDDLVVGLAKEGGHRANLQEEVGRLRQLKELGIPVVEPLGIEDFEGRPGLVMPRYEVGSKEIARQAKGSSRINIVGSSKYLNARSIQDLEHIRALLIKLEIRVGDLQFLIGRDGQVVINDPLRVTHKEPSDQNLKMINKLIEAERKNVR